VKAKMERLVDETGADELIIVTDTFDAADRHESYRRVAGIARSIQIKPSVQAGVR
jgi:hypothetical protein